MTVLPTGARNVLAGAYGVSKSYGSTTALEGVDFSVTAGETVGLLGPNGAGKSTLLNLLSGLRQPDSGRVELFGQDPRNPPARQGLGTTPQATSVPATLRVRETVDFVGSHYADPVPTAELLEGFGLGAVAGKQCGGLSGGQQRRLLVALALVGRPRLVILDEPTTGLDVEARENLWERLADYRAGGGTLLITSHYLDEIQTLASRVVVINDGSVVADGDVDAIRSRVSVSRVSFHTALPSSYFVSQPHTVSASLSASGATTVLTNDADDTVRRLVQDNVDFRGLEVHAASLEEAFISLTHSTAERKASR
ncbi:MULTISPECIES: ABC transporter ATP-binding protein [Arthrobacter]|uniref:ABC transporter ATP-binding protein n=1 Tax=Arthrobacter TaxID=1663 RepID=UPI001D15E1F0|nr:MULTISPECIES: ABC transporter ATP-binding protein [Arthrobacter]MCC3281453.1 ABC transporter ATP-binding protein [Arthrobacter caoxuetaonis]MCC9192369.1 ABC transporter ATP-binding protein [Arthrobacter sp. zg-Y916]